MFLNQFSVRIPEGKEQNGGYVELSHGKQYTLVLGNKRPERCNVQIEIDGKSVGTWRMEANDTITLERPAHDPGRFTFYEIDSPEAATIGLRKGDPSLGLVKVTFTPEMQQRQPPIVEEEEIAPTSKGWKGWGGNQPMQTYGGATRSAGGTGLSGLSNQQFGTAGAMRLDLAQQTVIHLRLVAVKSNQPRPLTAYSTPVPPPVG